METLVSLSEKRLIVEGRLNGKKACFLVDTGASVGLIDRRIRKEYGLAEGRKYPGRLVGAGGELSGVRYCDTFVELGSKKISQFLLADISQVAESVYDETGVEILGILSLPQMKFAGIRIDANDNLIMIE